MPRLQISVTPKKIVKLLLLQCCYILIQIDTPSRQLCQVTTPSFVYPWSKQNKKTLARNLFHMLMLVLRSCGQASMLYQVFTIRNSLKQAFLMCFSVVPMAEHQSVLKCLPSLGSTTECPSVLKHIPSLVPTSDAGVF